jgi:hypothetical protein
MHVWKSLVSLCLLSTSIFLNGCGGGAATISPTAPAATQGTVNFVVTDTPPTAITVLAFQLQITSAVLQPGNISILPRPVTVDLSQLATDTGLLASSVIDSGTYTSLTIAYANPKITIMNRRSAAITVAGTTCASGETCTFTPALNEASVTISNAVFPLTVTGSSTTGLNLDLSIPDLLQSDLSVTFANGSSVNLSLLPEPASGTSAQAEVDDVLATVTLIDGTQVTVTTALGDTLLLTDSSSTALKYPTSVCATSSTYCLAVGQIITTDLSVLGNGALAMNSVSYVGGSGASFVKGLVLSTDLTAAVPSITMLVRRGVNAASLSAGEIATVSIPSSTAFAIGSPAYPAPAGAAFSSSKDLIAGQELIVQVGSDLVAGSAPTFSTGTVYLEASQLVGEVASIDASNVSIEIDGLSGLLTGARPIMKQLQIDTGAETSFVGFSSDAFAAVEAGQFVATKGPLFAPAPGATASVGAIQIRKIATGN